jgi:hypothetical protein
MVIVTTGAKLVHLGARVAHNRPTEDVSEREHVGGLARASISDGEALDFVEHRTVVLEQRAQRLAVHEAVVQRRAQGAARARATMELREGRGAGLVGSGQSRVAHAEGRLEQRVQQAVAIARRVHGSQAPGRQRGGARLGRQTLAERVAERPRPPRHRLVA